MQSIKHFHSLRVLLVLAIFMLGGLQVINAQDPGTMLADSGFRPMENGFKFENYSEGYENLTAIELQRMFGDVACDTQKAKASGCKLSPTAQMWMDSTNESMGGGHCEGMAALSLLFYTNTEAASNFGADQTPEFTPCSPPLLPSLPPTDVPLLPFARSCCPRGRWR